jgi:phenylalanine-4-hydroxylase
VIAHEGKPIYIQTKGKQLWLLVKISWSWILSHAEGFVAQWKIKGINLAIEDMSPKDLCLQHNNRR